MVSLTASISVLILLSTVQALKLQPIENGKSHTIKNQDDGSNLVATADGKVTTGEYSGNARQKWIFNPVSDNPSGDIYTVTTEANENNSINGMGQQWELIKVGHGKRWLKNVQTGRCLQSAGRGKAVTEGECTRNLGKQRWYIEPVTQTSS